MPVHPLLQATTVKSGKSVQGGGGGLLIAGKAARRADSGRYVNPGVYTGYPSRPSPSNPPRSSR